VLLTAFVLVQVVFDLLVLIWLGARVLRRPPARAPAPDPAHREFLLLARDLLELVEPVLDWLESKEPAPASLPGETPPGPSPDRVREAFALARAGLGPREVGRQAGLGPGAARLVANLVAAEGARAQRDRSAP
jgi:hypothetical protein